MIIQLLIVLFAVALDRLSKIWLLDFLNANNGYHVLWPKVFSLTTVENTGAAFGMLKGGRWFFIVVTLVVLVALIVFLIISRKKTSWLFKISTALIIGGAIGNLIDRIDTGVVLDFFYFELINFAVFNVADSFVTIGAILLAISILFTHDFDDERKLKDEANTK
ncbi:MAG: signal peptidase II [Eubacteriales bacterium]